MRPLDWKITKWLRRCQEQAKKDGKIHEEGIYDWLATGVNSGVQCRDAQLDWIQNMVTRTASEFRTDLTRISEFNAAIILLVGTINSFDDKQFP